MNSASLVLQKPTLGSTGSNTRAVILIWRSVGGYCSGIPGVIGPSAKKVVTWCYAESGSLLIGDPGDLVPRLFFIMFNKVGSLKKRSRAFFESANDRIC